MRALMLEIPEELLTERRRKGLDKADEVWDGVLHMVPPPMRWHQSFGRRLLHALEPRVEALGLEIEYEIGLFRPGTGERDYRRPDLAIFRTLHASARGIEGKAEVVVEILSPGDESREKFGFYAACGVLEYWIVDPQTREFELYVLRSGKYSIRKGKRGAARSSVLDVTFTRVDGPKLRVSTPSGVTEI